MGDELAAFTIVGLTGNAICPISWSHHLVFLIPALVVLGDSALRRRRAVRGLALRGPWSRGPAGIPALAGLGRAVAALGVYLLFVVSPIWMYEHKLPHAVALRGRPARRALGKLARPGDHRADRAAAGARRRRPRVLPGARARPPPSRALLAR